MHRSKPLRYTMFASLYFTQGTILSYFTALNALYLLSRGLTMTDVGLFAAIALLPFVLKIFLGMLSDRVNLFRLGHRKPYILIGLLVQTICLIIVPYIDPAQYYWGFVAIAFILQMGMALYDTCTDGLALDTTPQEEQGTIQGFMVGGRALAVVVTASVLGLLAEYYADIKEFKQAEEYYTLLLNKDPENVKALFSYADYLLENEPPMYDPDYDDFLNSIKTALFFKEWINEKDEEYLLETYNVRPGEIRIKLSLADWLLYASEELTRMLKLKETIKEVIKIRLRLKHGIKEELLPLIKLENIGRVRARKLFNAGIKDIGEVKKAKAADLIQLLGKKVALKIKEQVGQKVKEVPKGTRKGQTSIEKF